MLDLNKLAQEVHQNAKAKGFFDDADKIDPHLLFTRTISLVHAELSEALEADRVNDHAEWDKFCTNVSSDPEQSYHYFACFIKDTVEDELADAILRILDYCAYLNIDIEKHLIKKLEYNKQRSYKHGKEY